MSHSLERRLFIASCVALVATAMTFAVRGDIMGTLEGEFVLSKTQLGWITGAAFWGFFLSIVIGGPLCDALGMGKIMAMAFLCHTVGILMTIFAPGFWILWAGTLVIGLGNGLVEAFINPLVATLYPNDKTHKLNVLHAWFPGGIVIGGLSAFALTMALGLNSLKSPTPASEARPNKTPTTVAAAVATSQAQPTLSKASKAGAATTRPTTARAAKLPTDVEMLMKGPVPESMGLETSEAGTSIASLGWKIKMAVILIPTLIYGLLFLGVEFPATERVASGVSAKDMVMESFRPLFLLWMFCMLLTASTELGPNQWISNIMEETVKMPGILVLVWISGLMCVMRFFGGPLAHRLSPIGLLMGSAFFSILGLIWLSYADSPLLAFLAATVFAVGVCYYWPTMLGVTSERFPKGGALLLGVMGGAGNISVALCQPAMGWVNDNYGPMMTLRTVAILPAVLIFIFGAIYLRDRAAGGYKAVKLTNEERPADD